MYAGQKPMRAAQPDKERVKQLIDEHQRSGQHPPSMDELRAIWQTGERAQKLA